MILTHGANSLARYVEIGGRKYPVVKIGNQLWMTENLDYKFDVNGSQIPIGPNGSPATSAAWYYNNDEANYGIDGTYKCGLLYNWYAAKYLNDNKATLLPDGWHIPSKTEWGTLDTSVSGSGNKLKSVDNSIAVNFPNGWNGTNEYGFSAVPSGDRWEGSFYDLNSSCTYWTTTEYSASRINVVALKFDPFLYLDDEKYQGFTIRLVKSLA